MSPAAIPNIIFVPGGLVYSHDLQTCDWPRNVACKTTTSSSSSSINSIPDSSGGEAAAESAEDTELPLAIESKKVRWWRHAATSHSVLQHNMLRGCLCGERRENNANA